MAALDWILIVVLAASMLLGAWRGLVYELLSLAGWVLAFVAAQWWGAGVGDWLALGQGPWRLAAGYVLVFVAVVFACGLLAWLVKKLIDAVGMRPADRALGALFGTARGVLVLLVLALVVGWSPLRDAPWWRESAGAALLQASLAQLAPLLPGGVQELPVALPRGTQG
ncbi:CvpA family protein [Comamonas faecalis]|uniref:CvpA family protein n=1 Tax=Comamonas faecalis TaxID=1387849 RepID=A0ABP7R654_9BURK